MKETSKNNQKRNANWISVLSWIPGLMLIVFLVTFSVLQTPFAQTKIINLISRQVAEMTGFDIKLDYANLTWYDHMILEKIKIIDRQGNEMVNIREMEIDFGFFDLILHRQFNAEYLELTSPQVNVIKESDSLSINISEFINSLNKLGKQEPGKPKTTLAIQNIYVTNGLFSFDDKRPGKSGREAHFSYDSLDANIQNFVLKNDSLNFRFVSFSGQAMDNLFNVKSLAGSFLYTKKSMALYDYELITDKSSLDDSVILFYEHPNQLKYFKDSIHFFARFDSTTISSDEIALFAPQASKLNRDYHVSGEFKGSIKKLSGKKVKLRFGRNTALEGNVAFSGLPNIRETFMEIECKKALINPEDLLSHIPADYQQRVLNAGQIDFKGQFLGFPTDFVANGEFHTRAGYMGSDINLKITNEGTATYSGNLTLKQFDLGTILSNHERYQKVNLTGRIRGDGLTIGSANFHLDARIDSIGVKGYNYSNIITKGKFSEGYFNGSINAHDPNLVFYGDVSIELKNKKNKFNVDAQLDTLNLQPLGLSNKDIFIASKIDADFKGIHLDSIKGYALLKDVDLKLNSKSLELDSVKLLSYFIQDNRHIGLNTDGLSMHIDGDFKNTTVIKQLSKLYKEVKLQLINNDSSLQAYYANEISNVIDPSQFDLKLNLWNVNKFLNPFIEDLKVSRDIRISGSFVSDTTSILSLNTRVDSLKWKGDLLLGTELDFELSKVHGQTNILSALYVQSDNQVWAKVPKTNGFILESIWSGDKIDVTTEIFQPKFDNHVLLQGEVKFRTDSTDIKINRSEIKVFDEMWAFDPDNLITLNQDGLSFESFQVTNQSQSLALQGRFSDNPEEILTLTLHDFDLGNLNAITPLTFAGLLDGNVAINRLKDDIVVQSNLYAESIYLDDFLVGNISCLSKWENTNRRLRIGFGMIRDGNKVVNIDGHIYPFRGDDQLDLKARFDGASVDIAEPFLKKRFSNLRGLASGQFDITGSLKAPVLLGSGQVNNGHMTVNYLNTSYTFQGDLVFTENEIGVSNLHLQDKEKNEAILNGGIFHDAFKEFIIDVQGDYSNFKVLNTSATDNQLYYGTAYATGNISFLGAVNNLQINASAKTNKGTRISIPIGDINDYTVDEKEYISFVDLSKSKLQRTVQKELEEVIDLKGLRLDFDLEITNDAYAELIFDVTAGDIIRGRGNGNINLQIDTNGEFNMFGDFQIEQGGYNFTLYNIINKEFDIKNGSSISWYGDPYGAKLNIDATYRQLASLAPMINDLDEDNLNSPQLRRKYPSIVDLNLKGDLLSPEITFDINIEDYPNDIELNDGTTIDMQTVIRAFNAKLQQNEQEMKRQVFSLVILRKFSPENNFSVNTQTIGNSLSEFVSNQLSYWATQVDENLEVDVNLAGLDEDAFNTFQLRLSYTFLDGRLRVTRGGGFSDTQNKSDIGTIIGDWTVEYLLTQDGRFRAKMYSRTNLNAANSQLGEDNTQTGFSLQFIRSFDELKQILSDSRNKSREQEKPNSNTSTTDIKNAAPTKNDTQTTSTATPNGGKF